VHLLKSERLCKALPAIWQSIQSFSELGQSVYLWIYLYKYNYLTLIALKFKMNYSAKHSLNNPTRPKTISAPITSKKNSLSLQNY